ncbi:MAG: DUF4124 domain-containing protein [Kangiellaceae bacterium]|nr:DUF4124 domain-containing protein [Kangiellaceae bacterium]
MQSRRIAHPIKILIFMCFFTGLFALLSKPATAQVYKWTDENGKVHYSDKPPENKKQRYQRQVQDHLTVTEMPKPLNTKALGSNKCLFALENIKRSSNRYRKELERRLGNNRINDMQFAEGLAKVDELKKFNKNSCGSTEPETIHLMNCLASSGDAISCVK